MNTVLLEGRVSRGPQEKVLPSGDSVVTIRVVMPRPEGARPGVDWVDCNVWSPRLRKRVATWAAGDIVQVKGSLRRRFYRGGGGALSLVEIEAESAKVIRRAARA